MDETKKCRTCGEVKPITEFHRNRKGSETRKNKCRICSNAAVREWNQRNPERARAKARERRAADLEAHREKEREYYQRTRERRLELKSVERFKKYGITPDEFFEQLEAQGRACAICQSALDGRVDPRNIHWDHCHKSGKFRGILCRGCNLMLGHAKDDPQILRKGADYLSR